MKERKERGLPARSEEESGQDARGPFLDPYSDIDIHEHHLPHWQQGDVFYFVTYRLAMLCRLNNSANGRMKKMLGCVTTPSRGTLRLKPNTTGYSAVGSMRGSMPV